MGSEPCTEPARFLSAGLVFRIVRNTKAWPFFNYTKEDLADREFQCFSCSVISVISFFSDFRRELFEEYSSQRNKLQFGKPG